MPKKEEDHGFGDICSVLIKRLHPTKIIEKKFPNAHKVQHIENLVCVGQELRMVNWKDQLCYIYTHKNFPDVQL